MIMAVWSPLVSIILLLVAMLAEPVIAEDMMTTSIEINEAQILNKLNQVDKNRRWYELRGYLNTKPVYMIVEKTGNRLIAGYLFDGKGNRTYIYGEWFRGELQVYDPNNTRLTILLSQ